MRRLQRALPNQAVYRHETQPRLRDDDLPGAPHERADMLRVHLPGRPSALDEAGLETLKAEPYEHRRGMVARNLAFATLSCHYAEGGQ
jgi:hypothetical protein